MSFLRCSLAALLLAANAWCQTPTSEIPPPFTEFADAFRKAHHIDVADSTGFDAQSVLTRDWISEKVGVFDLLYPRPGLDTKARQEELRDLVTCIIELEGLWLEWFGSGDPADVGRADAAYLKRWLGSAHLQEFKLSDTKLGIFAMFGASDKELATAARLVSVFSDGIALGYKPKGDTRPQIMFAPTREEFLELVAFFGWADADLRGTFWDNSAARWSECYWNATQVLSLEDAPSKANPSKPWAGVTMNLKAPTGVVEHVASRSTHSLCTTFFGYALDPAFQSGLCQNAAIALYGRNNARSGGAGRGNSVDGWSMFVPGGLSQGGILPGMSADSAWRSTFGSDWFVKPLHDSQRVASKDASQGREKISTFEVTADDKVKKLFQRAPFFGAAAMTKAVPAREFLSDYLEFFRAYKSCFVHWLFEEGAGKPGKPSHAKLALLLRSVASAADGAKFEELIAQCYGQPWSAADAKPDNLEWSFLAWLGRQK